jgi:predicted negative regulator of RcsB-dependent stress response
VLGLPFPASAPAKADLDKQLTKVQKALASNRPKRALKALQPLRDGPLADHVGLLRARVLREQGKPDEALAAAREAQSREPPTELAAVLAQEVARIHLARGDLLAAYRAEREAVIGGRS